MRKPFPSKAETALLQPFEALPLERIHVPASRTQFAEAAAVIMASAVVGFDTETKPVFTKGTASDGPHIVQFATQDRAFIFQLHRTECHPVLIELLQADSLLKVGFGLQSDRGEIQQKLGVQLRPVLDLGSVFGSEGYRGTAGVRAAVAIVLKRSFHKSKKTTTTNWAMAQLTPRQLLYAANDAFAALQVLNALDRPLASLPIVGRGMHEGQPNASDITNCSPPASAADPVNRR
jgi:ribonuclease D